MQRHLLCGENWIAGKASETDKLGQLLTVNLRDTFNPDAAFFNRMTKAQLLEIAHELGGNNLVHDFQGLKKGDLVSALDLIFAGAKSALVYGKEVIEAAKTWLPKNMAYPAPALAAVEAKKPAAKTSADKSKAKPAAKKATSVKKASNVTPIKGKRRGKQPTKAAA